MERRTPPAGAGPDVPARLWTPEEANARLEYLGELLPRLRAWTGRLGEVHGELHRLTEFWGKEFRSPDIPDRERRDQLESEWQNLTRRLEEAVDSLRREAIVVKDLETGLVDFYGRVNDEIVFLCWRRGEPEVGHYHRMADGFPGRRPLPNRARTPPSPGRPG